MAIGFKNQDDFKYQDTVPIIWYRLVAEPEEEIDWAFGPYNVEPIDFQFKHNRL